VVRARRDAARHPAADSRKADARLRDHQGARGAFHGCYTPSAGSVYPTLQLLEDQGYVRIVEESGKKVYHITPEGEAFLEENKDVLSEIGERIRDAMHGVAGGNVGEVNAAFATLAKRVFKDAWRNGPDSERTAKIAEILRRATADIEAL
jgi:DNA-binding PadR family transcriptional regulator